MSRMIFVNLPVRDLERSKAFYEAIGFRNEPKFTNDAAAMMVLSDTISVMLLTHPFYATFTRKPIADANNSSQVLLCISCESPAEVDRITDAAAAAGGKADLSQEDQTKGGPMYGRDFEDLDGHQWAPMWMDPELPKKARIRSITPTPRNIAGLGGENAAQDRCRDRDHRVPLGPRICSGAGPRPSPPLGARGSRPRIPGPPARAAAPARISAGTAVRPGSRPQRGRRPPVRERHDPAISGREERGAPARETQAKYRAIGWTYAALNSVEPALINLLLIDVFFTGEEWARLRRPGAVDFAKLKLKRVSDWLGDKQWLEGDRFTIGDLMMVTTLRFLRHTDLVAQFPNLEAFVKRGEARPAFQRGD